MHRMTIIILIKMKILLWIVKLLTHFKWILSGIINNNNSGGKIVTFQHLLCESNQERVVMF